MWEFLQTAKAFLQNDGSLGNCPSLSKLFDLELVEECSDIIQLVVAKEETALTLEVLRKHK